MIKFRLNISGKNRVLDGAMCFKHIRDLKCLSVLLSGMQRLIRDFCFSVAMFCANCDLTFTAIDDGDLVAKTVILFLIPFCFQKIMN